MKTRRVTRKRVPPKPRFYVSAVIRQIKAKNHLARPLPLDEFSSTGNQPDGGWAKFIPPGESIEVQLQIPEGGQPYEAMREWFLLREVAKSKRDGEFDLNRTAAVWNFGPGPDITKETCGWLHFSATWSTSWGPEIQRAMEVWEASGCRGPRPYDILAYLDPEQRVPILPWHPKADIPTENRLLCLVVDMARPLEDQFQELQRACQQIREYSLLLAGQTRKRPGRHEIRRDILVFTLHHAAGLTVAQVALEVFPNESPASSTRKVKDSLRRLRRIVDARLLRMQSDSTTQTK